MLRVHCSRLPLSVFCFIGFSFLTPSTVGECWYKDEMQPEGSEVITAEPCLNCTCNKGALLCYLRVCPTLPNPPPIGCILLHKYKTCCPELICTELLKNGNDVEARAEPDEPEILNDERIAGNACAINGSIYGPGSAMDSSSLCEYCYCLGGKQVCIKPKCLLPIEKCEPVYDTSNCCPVHYKCTHVAKTISTTTTVKAEEEERGGCTVDGIRYKEGGKVLGIGHSVCDNCYCLRGILRCEPLSCAPPLFGCSPVIRPGECCAVSYNCSGAIQIKPEPNYGEFPSISKEYAKLHKEMQKLLGAEADLSRTTKIQRNSDSFGTTRHFAYPSTVVSFLHNFVTTERSEKGSQANAYYITKNYDSSKKNQNISNFITDLDSETVSVLDDRLNRKVEALSTTEDDTTVKNEGTTLDIHSTSDYYTSTVDFVSDATTDGGTSTLDEESTETTPSFITMQTVLNSTDCIKSNSSKSEVTTPHMTINESSTREELISKNTATATISYTDLDTERSDKNVTLENATILLPPDIIINKNSDYEYDYNEPSLPPSLPNVRIIPFVAADALDSEKSDNALYAKEHMTEASPIHYNLFSPPVETEGGFVPKEPILDTFYENIATSTNVFPKLQMYCLYEGREVLHGEPVTSETACSTCNCYYGNIICEKMECPLTKSDCRKGRDLSLCCPRYVCDEETVAVVEQNSFKDVIHTEPAPNLQPERTSVLPTPSSESPEAPNDNYFSIDKVLNFLFVNQDQSTTSTSTSTTEESTTSSTSATDFEKINKKDDSRNMNAVDSPSMAILKLAGCNIYGRMYRVGRIISELSNPCLECRCTETGVQCRDLDC